MRDTITTTRTQTLLALLALALPLMTACPKHENFPQPLGVRPVPVPSNFTISQPVPDEFNYDLAWEIDDPDSLVVGYRVYLVGSNGLADEFLDETASTFFGLAFPFSASGAQLAVTAISSENVESYRALATIP